MTHLLTLLALIGHTAVLNTPIGTCEGTVVAPGQAVLEGTCSLDAGTPMAVGELKVVLVSARTLDSGRVVVRFGGAL